VYSRCRTKRHMKLYIIVRRCV